MLRVFAVVEPVERAFGWAGDWMYPEYRGDAVAAMRAELAVARGALAEPPARVTEEVLEGDPVTELLRISEQLDVLVLGSRGYGPGRPPPARQRRRSRRHGGGRPAASCVRAGGGAPRDR